MSNQQTRAHATNQANLDEITERLRHLGCNDHGCVVSKPKGLGTNGGRRCFEYQHLLPDERVRLREVLRLQRQQMDILHGLVERLRSERDKARAEAVAACATLADEYAAQEDVAGADACARLADAIRARGAGGAR